MRCVVDSSLALAWVLPGEASDGADHLLAEVAQDGAVAPAFWSVEVANALLLAERRARISFAQLEGALRYLGDIPIALEALSRERIWEDVRTVAAAHRLTVYDALYLEASVRLALPLASLDMALIRAARACGVPVLGPA
jgi:predicted nucleic acid-binding protein